MLGFAYMMAEEVAHDAGFDSFEEMAKEFGLFDPIGQTAPAAEPPKEDQS